METLQKLNIKTKFELLGNEANASLSLNPAFRWIKFILTDDKPNLNGDRIPKEEFANLIRTGINTPIKVAENTILPGHKYSLPIGVITNLIEEDDKVIGLAALWEAEREEDVNMLKDAYDSGEDINFSWEIFYRAEEVIVEGVRNLTGVILKAATIVGIPAYNGRTKVLAFASQNSSEEDTMTLEEALAKIAELTGQVEEKDKLIADKDNLLAEKETAIAGLNESITNLTSEKNELASYKDTIEAENAKTAKITAIKTKFTEAGIEKEDEYFVTNLEKFMAMSEEQFDFMLTEIVHLKGEASVTKTNVEIPNVGSNKEGKLSPKELAKLLRESNKTK
jgi:hypothetical protein